MLVASEMIVAVYRITDFRHISSSPEYRLKVLAEAMQGADGSTLDPRISPILLGDNRWSRLAQGIMKQPQYGNLHLPVFDSIKAALDYARVQLRLQRGV
ncbi:MAG: hypothetical protein ACPG7F_03720 [Aggregatilineales bacterium]